MRILALSLGAGGLIVTLVIVSQVVSPARASTPPPGAPGIIETFAGGGSDTTGNDIPALDAYVVPGSLAFAPNGDLYMWEFACRIRKVSDGIVSTVVGGSSCGFGGDGGPAIDAEISRPGAMAFDDAGNLYFTDEGNCAVRRVDAVTGVITTIGGHPPCDYSSYVDALGVPATDAHLGHTQGIAVDGTGVYVSEPDMCRIDRISGGMIERFAGAAPAPPYYDCSADGDGPALSVHLDRTDTLAIDSDGDLLLGGWWHCDIREVAGAVVSTLSDNACWPLGNSEIPSLAAGDANSVFFVDYDDCKARVWRDGATYTVAGVGFSANPCGFSGDGGPAIDARLDMPSAIALDGAGNLYIADLANGLVRVVYGANLDTDDDGMDDASEGARSCLQPYVADGTDDADGDGLDNLSEVRLGTDPCSGDTDGDGMEDAYEAAHWCLDPLVYDGQADADWDGVMNVDEEALGSDPCVADVTPTPTVTLTPTAAATDTPTPTATMTDTPSPTDTATGTPTDTPTPTDTATNTPTPTGTATDTPTATATPPATNTPTPAPTDTATSTPTLTATASATATDTASPTATATLTPTGTAAGTPTAIATPPATDTPTPTASGTSTPTPTETATETGTPTATATAEVDSDGDGLSDHDEVDVYHTDPLNPDTDGDGYTDGQEAALGKDALTYCDIIRADVDGSGTVNILDLSNIAKSYNQTIPPAPARLDQNADGKINILDLSLPARRYNQTIAACP